MIIESERHLRNSVALCDARLRDIVELLGGTLPTLSAEQTVIAFRVLQHEFQLLRIGIWTMLEAQSATGKAVPV